MAYEFIRVDREGPVTTITLNRPEVMNALHSPAHFELDDAFNAFAADPDQWVGIVTGAGERAFSAGNDLKHQAGGGGMATPPSGFAGLTSRFDLTKPLIAAVNDLRPARTSRRPRRTGRRPPPPAADDRAEAGARDDPHGAARQR